MSADRHPRHQLHEALTHPVRFSLKEGRRTWQAHLAALRAIAGE